MKSIFMVAVVLGLASSEAFTASIETQAQGLAPWYSCAGKKTGNYIHPRDCHMFISCTDAGLAYEMDCGPCNTTTNPAQCFTGKLIYDMSKDQCVWENEATCSTGPDPTVAPTTEASSAATVTVAPPATSEPPTSPPLGKCVRPVENSTCDPLDCLNCGICQDYWVCDKSTSRWRFGKCSKGSFFDINAGGKVHGGDCAPWGDLSSDLKDELWRIPDCLECQWKALGECNNQYDYLERNSPTLLFQRLKCGTDLVFDEKALACIHCSEAKTSSGSACCTKTIPTDF